MASLRLGSRVLAILASIGPQGFATSGLFISHLRLKPLCPGWKRLAEVSGKSTKKWAFWGGQLVSCHCDHGLAESIFFFFFLPEFTSFCGLAGAYGDGKKNKCGVESLAGWLVGHPGG